MTTIQQTWPTEFAKVIACNACTAGECRKLLRDDAENIPQPGYIGKNYAEHRVLLVGQNPSVSTGTRVASDRVYTAALRELAQNPTAGKYQALSTIMNGFVPTWPVHGNYFPLAECGLTLQDIAYFNAVRCRTIENTPPSPRQAQKCVGTYFRRWVDLLEPRVVVFIGKWAHEQCRSITDELKIPSAFMNRQRSLSGFERTKNRREVVTLVKERMQ